MTAPDLSRRQLLRALGGLVAVGAGAGAARLFTRTATQPDVEPVESTTRPPTTTAPPRPTTTAPPEPTSTAGLPTVAIPVLCREAWGAAPATGTMERHTIARLTVHHTAAPISDASLAPAHIRGHQRFHQQDRGWPDIAYHFLIDPAGNIYQGRDVTYRGDTATEYDPTGHFLVCLDGDFDADVPGTAQLDSLVAMLAVGASTYRVDPSTIAGHRDYAVTSCPGANVAAIIDSGTLEDRVRSWLAEAVPVIDLVCGASGADAVEAIESGAA